jgi:hypothetical protein
MKMTVNSLSVELARIDRTIARNRSGKLDIVGVSRAVFDFLNKMSQYAHIITLWWWQRSRM